MKLIDYSILVLNSLWHITLEMSPYLLLGFLFAGILHVFIPPNMVSNYMGKSSIKSVIYSALLGVPLPLCSCGVIPTGISLYNNGASKGSTVSFLISTPQTGVDSIMISYSLLGLPFALIRPIVAFVTGIFGGFLTNVFDTKPVDSTISKNKINATEVHTQSGNVFLRLFNYAFIELLGDIAKWLVIGLVLAAIIDIAIPPDFFSTYLYNDFLSMFVILLVSVPLYICATSSVPIAAMLMLKGLSPGAALVFLMAGPATNAATITVLSKVMGKRSLVVYLFSIIFGSMFFGYLINQLPSQWFVLPAMSMHANHMDHHILPDWLTVSSTIFLIVMILINIYLMYFSKKTNAMTNLDSSITISVDGMTCSKCALHVENSIKNIPGIQSVLANNASGEVLIQANQIDTGLLKEAVEKAGYTYVGVK